MNTLSMHAIARAAMHSDRCQVRPSEQNKAVVEHVVNLALVEIAKASKLYLQGPVAIDLGNGHQLVCEAKKMEGK